MRAVSGERHGSGMGSTHARAPRGTRRARLPRWRAELRAARRSSGPSRMRSQARMRSAAPHRCTPAQTPGSRGSAARRARRLRRMRGWAAALSTESIRPTAATPRPATCHRHSAQTRPGGAPRCARAPPARRRPSAQCTGGALRRALAYAQSQPAAEHWRWLDRPAAIRVELSLTEAPHSLARCATGLRRGSAARR